MRHLVSAALFRKTRSLFVVLAAAVLYAGCDAGSNPQGPDTTVEDVTAIRPGSDPVEAKNSNSPPDSTGTECSVWGTGGSYWCPTWDPWAARKAVLEKLLADPVARDGVRQLHRATRAKASDAYINSVIGAARYRELREKPAEYWT